MFKVFNFGFYVDFTIKSTLRSMNIGQQSHSLVRLESYVSVLFSVGITISVFVISFWYVMIKENCHAFTMACFAECMLFVCFNPCHYSSFPFVQSFSFRTSLIVILKKIPI